MDFSARIRTYYYLTKPGIIYGNVLNATSGFLLAAIGARSLPVGLYLATIVGTSLVIAAGCVYNNYIDRHIDEHMARTKKRALVTGKIPGRTAMVYATVLVIVGFTVLAVWTNWLVVAVGALGFVDYVVLYSYAKRRSVHGTLVGSISGATPPVAGYVALTGHLDAAAIILFIMLVLWQMPHFYAIAMYRLKDYTAAGIPVLPAKKGLHHTKVQILLYVIAFTLAALALTVWGYTGYVYAVVMTVVCVGWLRLALRGFHTVDDAKWARKMFFFSLVVTLATTVMIPAGALLP
jgi:protoheme IX farnesyltransferase